MPRKRTKNVYWTEETEQAIQDYNKEKDENKRNKIFSEKIWYPLNRLVEAVYNQVKPIYIIGDANDVMADAIVHITPYFHRVNGKKGKAFSYFTVSVRNYFILQNKLAYRNLQRDYYIDSLEDFDIADDNYIYRRLEDVELIHAYCDWIRRNIDKIWIQTKSRKLALFIIDIIEFEEIIYKKDFYDIIRNEYADAACKDKNVLTLQARRLVIVLMDNFYKFKAEWDKSGMILKDSDIVPFNSRKLKNKTSIRSKYY